MDKNKYGQYFTPQDVAEYMVDLSNKVKEKECLVLEPCCGEGVFLDIFKSFPNCKVDAYEIDNTLAHNHNVIYKSFVSADITKKYDLIIGNPPYIRWKNLEDELKEELKNSILWDKYFNSLCDYLYIFILKSIESLGDGGELIFICPEYWFNTTHSKSLRNYMLQNGYFEHITHFNETPIFEKVTVSTIIFKYVKSKISDKKDIELLKYHASKKLTKSTLEDLQSKKENVNIEFLRIPQFKENERWILAEREIQEELKNFEEKCLVNTQKQTSIFTSQNYYTIGEICDIGNGMVSGLDKAFQLNGSILNDLEKTKTIEVIKAKNLNQYTYEEVTKYIYLNDTKVESEEVLKNNYPNFYNHLIDYEEDLKKRYAYNRDINFWEWVFLRNFNLFSNSDEKIFVPCKERISNKDYFRFSLVKGLIYPTQDVTALVRKKNTKESAEYILGFLNNKRVFDWLKFNGIVKGSIVEFSEKPISSIPFRLINWNDSTEVKLHDEITDLVKKYIKKPTKSSKIEIEGLFDRLF